MTQRRSAAQVADRPSAVGGRPEVPAVKRSFATCGKLGLTFMESSWIARSTQMTSDLYLRAYTMFSSSS